MMQIRHRANRFRTPLLSVPRNPRLYHRLLSLLVVLTMLLPNTVWLPPGASARIGGQNSLLAQPWPEAPQSVEAGGLLFRTRVRLANPFDRTRLDKMEVAILSEGPNADGTTWAVVLADEKQLEDLARLRYEPEDTDEFVALVNANAEAKPAISASLWPLVSRATEAQRLKSFGAPTADNAVIEVRQIMASLTPEQRAGTASFSTLDDDGDGLTNTQEQWWCTDPLNGDTDGDTRSDGQEIKALKDWLGNRVAGPPFETPWPDWPLERPGCPDKDRDSIPNLAEVELGLSMDLESSDGDKFDDGQELFGVTYCPGGDSSCSYGALPRTEDTDFLTSEMPRWIKTPGNHPLVAAYPAPVVAVVPNSLRVQTVTSIETNEKVEQGEQVLYSTSVLTGTKTGEARTKTWNDWQETSEAISQRLRSISPSQTPYKASDWLNGTVQTEIMGQQFSWSEESDLRLRESFRRQADQIIEEACSKTTNPWSFNGVINLSLLGLPISAGVTREAETHMSDAYLEHQCFANGYMVVREQFPQTYADMESELREMRRFRGLDDSPAPLEIQPKSLAQSAADVV